METQHYFCSDTLSPGSESMRICLYFLGHMPPSQQVDTAHRLSRTALGWPCCVPETELTLMLSGCGRVEWALDFQWVGWIQVPNCGGGTRPLTFIRCFLIFPSTCVHSHLLSHVVQWCTRRGKESAHFIEEVNEYPGGSTCFWRWEEPLLIGFFL